MAHQLIGAVGIAIRLQSAYGTINPSIDALTTSCATSDGLLLGVGDAGFRNSGITLPKWTREALQTARVGYSVQPSTLDRVVRSGLSVVAPWGGARSLASTPVVSADMAFSVTWPAMFGALSAAGLVPADGGVLDTYIWTPGAASYCSIALWDGVYLYKLRDNLCKLTFSFPAQRTPTVKIEVVQLGTLDSARTKTALGTITPGTQLTAVSKVASMVSTYGAVVRDFTECEVVVEPNITVFSASNPSGDTVAQDGVTVSLSMTMIADDADADFDEDRLDATAAPTHDFTFGTAATSAGAVQLGWQMALNNLDLEEVEVDAVANRYAKKITGKATIGSSGTAGTEFALTIR